MGLSSSNDRIGLDSNADLCTIMACARRRYKDASDALDWLATCRMPLRIWGCMAEAVLATCMCRQETC